MLAGCGRIGFDDPLASQAWRAVSVGNTYACAIGDDGTLWCWGDDGAGQLGDGDPGERALTPQQVGTATDWAEVGVGDGHTCARRTDGTLWCWGRDKLGQLGLGVPLEQQVNAPAWAPVATSTSVTSTARPRTTAGPGPRA